MCLGMQSPPGAPKFLAHRPCGAAIKAASGVVGDQVQMPTDWLCSDQDAKASAQGHGSCRIRWNRSRRCGRLPKTDGHTITLLWRAQQASELSELWNAVELRNVFLLVAWPDLHCCKGSQRSRPGHKKKRRLGHRSIWRPWADLCLWSSTRASKLPSCFPGFSSNSLRKYKELWWYLEFDYSLASVKGRGLARMSRNP